MLEGISFDHFENVKVSNKTQDFFVKFYEINVDGDIVFKRKSIYNALTMSFK